MNVVHLFGRLAEKPELKTSRDGKFYATFRMATNNAGGDADWHSVIVFAKGENSKLAEAVAKHLDKGSQCVVEGRLKYQEFEKDGIKQKRAFISADEVHFGERVSGPAAQRAQMENASAGIEPAGKEETPIPLPVPSSAPTIIELAAPPSGPGSVAAMEEQQEQREPLDPTHPDAPF